MNGRVFDPRAFGPRLKAAREARGMTQRELRKAIGHGGTSVVRQWEAGKVFPGFQYIALIALALDVSTDELFFGGAP